MFAELGRREARHLAHNDGEARFFKAIDHFANVTLFHAIGFEDHERFLHSPPRKPPAPDLGSLEFGVIRLLSRSGSLLGVTAHAAMRHSSRPRMLATLKTSYLFLVIAHAR